MFCNIPGMSQPKDAPALATELTEMGIEFEDRQICFTTTVESAVCWRSWVSSWTANAITAR